MAQSKRALHIACDIGGTFTDLVAQAGDGTTHVRKVPTTPEAPGVGVIQALSTLLGELGVSLTDVVEIVHGTTVGSNIILQKSGARTGLITTRGFRDVLEIGRIRTPTMFDIAWEKPSPLVTRRHRLEVSERMGADGKVVVPLDEREVLEAGERLTAEGVETVALCFLHSCVNPIHERHARDLLREVFPDLLVTASCDVLPEIKEYERTSTTVVNAYLLPGMQQYLRSLAGDLAEAGMQAPILVIASSGGMMQIETATEKPVFAVGSGPAGGVIGSTRLGRLNGYVNAIAFDMGGTTAKASIIENGEPTITSEYEFRDGLSTSTRFIKGGGYMLKVPTIDIAEVGAGGGSLAWIDEGGLLQVGPRSAGAVPGPACYALGNDQPTVTDANVVLGILNSASLAGGTMPIDALRSAEAVEKYVAEPLGLGRIAAAAGIRRIANVAMARAIRSVTVERGRDPRDMALIAFGGSGPAHAVDVARILGIQTVIVPVMSGVFSAVGMLGADVEHNLVHNLIQRLDLIETRVILEVIADLEQGGCERLKRDGFDASDFVMQFSADMHYLGQSSELTVGLDPAELERQGTGLLESSFHDAYLQTYGYQNDEPVELVNVRLTALGVRQHRLAFEEGDPGAVRSVDGSETRSVWYETSQNLEETVVRPRSAVEIDPLDGPVILEAYDTTIVIPAQCSATTDGCHSVVIALSDEFMEDST